VASKEYQAGRAQRERSKTQNFQKLTWFPASIEPCAVSMCGAGGSPHSVGRDRLDAQLGCASRFSAPGGGANARRCAGIIDVSERASIEPYAVSMCGAGGYSVGSASRLAMHCLYSAWKSLPPQLAIIVSVAAANRWPTWCAWCMVVTRWVTHVHIRPLAIRGRCRPAAAD